MTTMTKHEVIKEELARYLKANKREKGRVLDRLGETIKMHRKAIIRRFRVLQTKQKDYNWSDNRGRPTYYTKDVAAALHEVWVVAHELCAERLHPITREYVEVLRRDKMWKQSNEATGKLLAMSLGTMKGLTQAFDRTVSGGGRSMTKPSSLKEVIPVRRGPWDNPPPGHGEIDTVAHCGNAGEGLFASTVQYTDICLTWCFLGAQMGKGKIETLENLKAMEARSPFPFRGLDPDTGSEFVNWTTKDWCDEKNIELTRIRPGMKNDHGHIEQKNDKNVRGWAGYIRVDTEERLAVLNAMYRVLETYINHFQPSMKCIRKVRHNISHSSRKYDKAKTPYQRFVEHAGISTEAKKKMRALHATLNPKVLHDELLRLRKKLFTGAKFTRNLQNEV